MELEMKKVIFLSTAIVVSFLESATPYDGMEDFSSLGYRRPREEVLLVPSEEPAQRKMVPSGTPHASTDSKHYKKREMKRFQPFQHRMDTPQCMVG